MATSEIRITNPDWVAEAVDFHRLYPDDDARVRVAITLARENVQHGTGGPFGAADEEALMHRHRIDLLISKESGGEATYGKIAAARTLNLPVIMISRPATPAGVRVAASIDDAIRQIGELCKKVPG